MGRPGNASKPHSAWTGLVLTWCHTYSSTPSRMPPRQTGGGRISSPGAVARSSPQRSPAGSELVAGLVHAPVPAPPAVPIGHQHARVVNDDGGAAAPLVLLHVRPDRDRRIGSPATAAWATGRAPVGQSPSVDQTQHAPAVTVRDDTAGRGSPPVLVRTPSRPRAGRLSRAPPWSRAARPGRPAGRIGRRSRRWHGSTT